VDTARGPDITLTAAAPRTTFVLLGGGAHGAAQSGALTALIEAGIRPDELIGVSAGAWNAAFWACEPDVARAHTLEELWIATSTKDILGALRWRHAVSAVVNRGTLYDADGLRRMAERHLGKSLTFADLKLPLRVLAVNITRGDPVFFTDGSVQQAVLASAAIPGVFPPVLIDDEYYVDGSLDDWSAIHAAKLTGAQRIFLISCGAVTGKIPRIQTLTGLIERSWDLAGVFKFHSLVQTLGNSGAEVIVIQPEIPALSPLDFNQASKLIELGHAAGQAALARVAAPVSAREQAS
jgi:NTE family protein